MQTAEEPPGWTRPRGCSPPYTGTSHSRWSRSHWRWRGSRPRGCSGNQPAGRSPSDWRTNCAKHQRVRDSLIYFCVSNGCARHLEDEDTAMGRRFATPVRGRRVPSRLAVHHHSLLVRIQRVDNVVGLLEEDGAKLFAFCKGWGGGGGEDATTKDKLNRHNSRATCVWGAVAPHLCHNICFVIAGGWRRAIKSVAAVGEAYVSLRWPWLSARRLYNWPSPLMMGPDIIIMMAPRLPAESREGQRAD